MTEKTVNQSRRVKKATGRFLRDAAVATAGGIATLAFSAATLLTVTSGAGDAIDHLLPKNGSSASYVSVSGGGSSTDKGILAVLFGGCAAISALGTGLALGKALGSSERLRITKAIVEQEYEDRHYQKRFNP